MLNVAQKEANLGNFCSLHLVTHLPQVIKLFFDTSTVLSQDIWLIMPHAVPCMQQIEGAVSVCKPCAYTIWVIFTVCDSYLGSFVTRCMRMYEYLRLGPSPGPASLLTSAWLPEVTYVHEVNSSNACRWRLGLRT